MLAHFVEMRPNDITNDRGLVDRRRHADARSVVAAVGQCWQIESGGGPVQGAQELLARTSSMAGWSGSSRISVHSAPG